VEVPQAIRAKIMRNMTEAGPNCVSQEVRTCRYHYGRKLGAHGHPVTDLSKGENSQVASQYGPRFHQIMGRFDSGARPVHYHER
jgi:hypothetical protein